MRISDWSSDVCSSDLNIRGGRCDGGRNDPPPTGEGDHAQHGGGARAAKRGGCGPVPLHQLRWSPSLFRGGPAMTDFLLELRGEEIPARMQAGARAELVKLLRAQMSAAGIETGDLKHGRASCRDRECKDV